MRNRFLILSILVGCVSPTLETTALCGDDAAIADAGADAPPDAPPVWPGCISIAHVGQSNDRGTAGTNEISSPFTASFPDVETRWHVAKGVAWPVNPPWINYAGATVPHPTWNATPKFGVELTLARGLRAEIPETTEIRLLKGAVDDTTMTQWAPTGPLFDDVHDWIADNTSDCPLVHYTWWQGESDARVMMSALTYETNLTGVLEAVRTRFPGVPIGLAQLHEDTNPATTPYVAQVRLAEQNVAATMTDVELYNLDDFVLRGSDHVHFSPQSFLDLGWEFAIAIVDRISP